MSDTPDLTRRAVAEGLGTFALVFRGAIITNAERADTLGTVAISLVFGLVILAAIAAFGHLSGAHFPGGYDELLSHAPPSGARRRETLLDDLDAAVA